MLIKSSGDLNGRFKDCPFGQDIKDDCKKCDYSKSNHYDPITGKCVKR